MTENIDERVPAVVEATRLFGLGAPVQDPLFGAGADREAAFTARVRAAGVVTPADVRSPTGTLIVAVGDQRFRAFSWSDLDAAMRPPLSGGVLADIGRLVATLSAGADHSSVT